jgi:hypothetical protein
VPLPTHHSAAWNRLRVRVDLISTVLAIAVVALATIGGTGTPPTGDAAPPPPGRFHHGAAGTARNGFGGAIAPSPTMASWPGTGAGTNGGPFAFIGAHYGSLWGIPAGPNNSMGVGYCVMEDLAGERTVTLRPDPPQWDAGESARAAALMASFGGDRVVPYGIDASGPYDVATGEWQHPDLFGGGEYTRRRHVAVNFGVKMFVEDVSPSGVVAGRKLARDTAVVDGSGADFAALRSGYRVAQHLATVADIQHAVGGITLRTVWGTHDGRPPTRPGTYPIAVHVTDSTGKPVGFVPVLQLSEIGIGPNRSSATTAIVQTADKTPDDHARWSAAAATGWPTLEMGSRLAADARFRLPTEPRSADVTDANGTARFDVTITSASWELAFHAQAPTANVDLYAGTGVQGQITWSGPPQSASTHQAMTGRGRFVVRKALDAADIQGDRNMAGFTFVVVARPGPDPAADAALSADPVGLAGSAVATVTTGTDGRSPTIELPPGPYRIVETGRPPWASGLGDGGPVDLDLDDHPDDHLDDHSDDHPDVQSDAGPVREVIYTNTVPTAAITTAASAVDGTKFLREPDPDPGSVVVVDRITYTGLVPGTPYVARGELMVDACTREHTHWCDDPVATAETAFVPDTADGTIEVRFTVAADAIRGRSAVALQRIVVGDRTVAEHRDLDDPAQTVYFPLLTSRLELLPANPADVGVGGDGADVDVADGDSDVVVDGDDAEGPEVVDHVTYAGLQHGITHRMEMTLHERSAEGICRPTGQRTALDFVPERSTGTVAMRGLRLPRAGVFVAFDRLVVDDTVIATHDDCDNEAQTVTWSPPTIPPIPTIPTTTTDTGADPPPEPGAATTSPPAPSTVPPVTTSVPAPAPASQRPSIARTGNADAWSMLGGGLALTMTGAGALLMARRRTGVTTGSATSPTAVQSPGT